MGVGPVEIEDVVRAFEDRITTATAGTVPDLLDAGQDARGRLHMGCTVFAPSSDGGASFRNPAGQFAEDTVQVTTFFEVKPKDQRASRKAAHAWEKDLRDALMHRAWWGSEQFEVAFNDTERSLEGGWIRIVHSFTVGRWQRLGWEA